MDKAAEIQSIGGRAGALQRPARAGRMAPLLVGLLLVALAGLSMAGAAVLGFQLVYSDTFFPGVQVGDLPAGGMTREMVLAHLEPVFAERVSRPLRLQMVVAEREARLEELGASFDVAATVDAAYALGRTGDWLDRLSAQYGAVADGYRIAEPGIRVDRSKLESYLAERAREIESQVRDAELVIGADLGVRVTPSEVGRKLDVAGAALAVQSAILAGAGSVELPVVETRPRRLEKDLEEADTLVSRMFSGPAALEFEGRRWSLGAREIAALVSVEQKEGVPSPVVTLREEPLVQMVDRIAPEVEQPKVTARFDWEAGKLRRLTPGQDGRTLDKAKALAALKGALAGERRVVPLPVEVDRAAGGSLNVSSLGIKELVMSASTSFAGAVPEKVHNIKLAASRLNGVVVPPGESFSFNKELGPTTLKSGYQVGFGIAVNNGEMQTVPSVAGGICQVSTTLLHAVFWAGYPIEERWPHMYWIPGYGALPRGLVGLDATVDDPNLDFQFVNNTDSHLLIQSKVEGNTLEFALYGTKPTWRVEVEGPVITNVVKADQTPVRQEEPTMPEGKEVWVERATDGMDVTILRRVIQGNDVRTLRVRSSYQPSRNVLMVGTRKAEPEPTTELASVPSVATP